MLHTRPADPAVGSGTDSKKKLGSGVGSQFSNKLGSGIKNDLNDQSIFHTRLADPTVLLDPDPIFEIARIRIRQRPYRNFIYQTLLEKRFRPILGFMLVGSG